VGSGTMMRNIPRLKNNTKGDIVLRDVEIIHSVHRLRPGGQNTKGPSDFYRAQQRRFAACRDNKLGDDANDKGIQDN
jgi:hypothetical protein